MSSGYASTAREYIATLPAISKWYTVALLLCSALARSGVHIQLVAIPRYIHYYPWTFLTASITETRFLAFLFDLLIIPFILQFMDRLWGSREALKFAIMIPVLANVIGVCLWWIVWFVSWKYLSMFPFGLRGPDALIAGALVAYGQFNNMAIINLFFFFPVRVKNIPFFQAILGLVVYLIDGENPFLLSLIGCYISWVYLRFYQRRQADTIGNVDPVGDWSETFGFEYWFPEPLRPAVQPFANTVYLIASKLRLVPQDNSDPLGLGGDRLGSAEDDRPGLLATLMKPFSLIAELVSSIGARFRSVSLPPDDESRASLLGGQEESAAARRERMLRAVDNRLASSTPTSPAPPTPAPGANVWDNKPPPPYQGGSSSGF